MANQRLVKRSAAMVRAGAISGHDPGSLLHHCPKKGDAALWCCGSNDTRSRIILSLSGVVCYKSEDCYKNNCNSVELKREGSANPRLEVRLTENLLNLEPHSCHAFWRDSS